MNIYLFFDDNKNETKNLSIKCGNEMNFYFRNEDDIIKVTTTSLVIFIDDNYKLLSGVCFLLVKFSKQVLM